MNDASAGSNAVLRLDLRSGRTGSIPPGEEVKPQSTVIMGRGPGRATAPGPMSLR
jgi:hypothetical protein